MPDTPAVNLSRRSFLAATIAAASSAPYAAAFGPTGPIDLSAQRAQRVIVIGAGVSGLAAAWTLHRAGHDVTVVESRTRPGGRVHTIRDPFADDLYAEAGAMFTGGPYVMRYVKAFGLTLVPPAGPEATTFRIGDTRLRVGPDTESVSWPMALEPHERARTGRELAGMYLGPVFAEIGNPTDPDWPGPAARQYDRLSLDALLERRGASPGARALMRLSVFDLFGDGIGTVSALLYLRDMVLMSSGGVGVFDGGSDQLPEAFAQRLGSSIQYGCVVRRAAQSERGVSVTIEQYGVQHQIEADRLICTVPLSVMDQITFSPALPEDKLTLIQTLPYSSITRVYLQTRRRFWEDDGASGVAYTDGVIPRVLVHPMARATSRGILEAHFGKATARTLAEMDEQDRVAFAASHLESIHPGLKAHAEGGTSHSWVNDPWTRGGYSSPSPGMLLDSLRIGARAAGRFHFAGEHTSRYSASLEGAIESGERAAQEVMNAVAP